jgi:DNA replication and repair protein RecF
VERTVPAALRLSVAQLTLTGFRSYAGLRIETDPRPVVLTGANGAGKTNLLEALSFLVPGRGLRRARLSDISCRLPQDVDAPLSCGWAVAVHMRGSAGLVNIGTGIADDTSDRRLVRIDGAGARGQAALSEHVSAVWLTPRMDRLFADGASARRRFLDRLVFGFDAAHAGRVSAYEHSMRERSRLLRDGQAGQPVDSVWINTLEDTMATRGIAVAAARRDMALRLDEACIRGVGPFPAASLRLIGDVPDWLAEMPALDAEDRLRQGLARARRGDAMAAAAAVGPHKDDLEVRHRGKGLPAADCSTGEQKAMLIAIVLADARLQAAERGTVPLLLLDEVVAHLDDIRRHALFDELVALNAQAWMTGTDAELFSPLGSWAQRFTVADAIVSPS